MAYNSLDSILEICEKEHIEFFQVILNDDCKERGISDEASRGQMESMWNAMMEASNAYEGSLRSKSGLVGGDGLKMQNFIEKENNGFCGSFVDEVISEALKMAESNACMKRIVAAPTAGSCGVLPAVLIPYIKRIKFIENEKDTTEIVPDVNNLTYKIINAMYVSAGIGQVIAKRAYISGAAGGCQAEVGSASAMAAGALVYLKGGNNYQICEAVAMSMKNLLGLVCDPVAGLVEVPCVKRNVIGSINALASADMALAGITSAIPADQVIDAMREIGDNMHQNYKETAKGGCAVTQKGRSVMNQIMSLDNNSNNM